MYAMCTTMHTASWGTKGDNGMAKDFGGAKKTTGNDGPDVFEVELLTAREYIRRFRLYNRARWITLINQYPNLITFSLQWVQQSFSQTGDSVFNPYLPCSLSCKYSLWTSHNTAIFKYSLGIVVSIVF